LKGLVVDREISPDPFAALKDGSEEYHVYDKHYEKIGRVDDVFIDERDAVSYIGIKMGFFGTNSTLVPVELVRVNDLRRLIEVDEDAETIKHAPHFGHDETVLPELEDRVRTYFGLEPLLPPKPEETYHPEAEPRFGSDARVDTEPGERVEDQNLVAGQPTGTPAAGEPVDAPSEDRWNRETSEGGVVFHRRRM
jgi:PRC-barrel domain